MRLEQIGLAHEHPKQTIAELSADFDFGFSTTSLQVAAVLAEAWSFVRVGIIRRETVCRA